MTAKELIAILKLICAYSCIIPAIIGIRNYNKLSSDFKSLTWMVIICFLLELPSYYLHDRGKNNLFIMHIYTILEFVLLGYVYRIHLKRLIPPWMMTMIIVLFCTYSIFNSIFIQPININNSYALKGYTYVLGKFGTVGFFNSQFFPFCARKSLSSYPQTYYEKFLDITCLNRMCTVPAYR
jgi:hypothetical protein